MCRLTLTAIRPFWELYGASLLAYFIFQQRCNLFSLEGSFTELLYPREPVTRTLISLLFLLLTSRAATAQVPDSCLKFVFIPTDTIWHHPTNPDSLRIDSCVSSATFGEMYARGWFGVEFQYYVLPAAWGPEDTIIDRHWSDIDTQYPAARLGFQALEAKYGNFYFRKQQPDVIDTSRGRSSIFKVWFSDYVNVDSVVDEMSRIPFVDVALLVSHIVILANVQQSKSEGDISTKLVIKRSDVSAISRLWKDLSGSNPGREIKIFDVVGSTLVSQRGLTLDDFVSTIQSCRAGIVAVQSGDCIKYVLITE